jgi:ADP-ribose pyrophosphatase YjhB (NUDIX family)
MNINHEFIDGDIEHTVNPDYTQLVTVCVMRGDAILLIRRTTPPFLHYYSVPGGGVEPNEGYEAAARRELQEEASITAKPLQPLYVFMDHEHALECHAFRFDSPDGAFSNPDPSEQEVVGWRTVSEALQLPLTPGLAEAIVRLASVE